MLIPIQIYADAENVTFTIPSQSRTETIPAYMAQHSASFAIIALGEEAHSLYQGKEPLKTNTEQRINGSFQVTQPFRPEVFNAPGVVAFIRYYLVRYYFDIRSSSIQRFLFSPFDHYDCTISLEDYAQNEDNMKALTQAFKDKQPLLSVKRLQIHGRKIW